MCAHPSIDPVTGEMIVFRYDVEAPFLIWAIVGARRHGDARADVVPTASTRAS